MSLRNNHVEKNLIELLKLPSIMTAMLPGKREKESVLPSKRMDAMPTEQVGLMDNCLVTNRRTTLRRPFVID